MQSRAPRASTVWGALGTHTNQKRRLTLEDVGRRFLRPAAVFDDFKQVTRTPGSDVVVELELAPPSW
jgi:hypothetical protein